jgi:hypothetical protein
MSGDGEWAPIPKGDIPSEADCYLSVQFPVLSDHKMYAVGEDTPAKRIRSTQINDADLEEPCGGQYALNLMPKARPPAIPRRDKLDEPDTVGIGESTPLNNAGIRPRLLGGGTILSSRAAPSPKFDLIPDPDERATTPSHAGNMLDPRRPDPFKKGGVLWVAQERSGQPEIKGRALLPGGNLPKSSEPILKKSFLHPHLKPGAPIEPTDEKLPSISEIVYPSGHGGGGKLIGRLTF